MEKNIFYESHESNNNNISSLKIPPTYLSSSIENEIIISNEQNLYKSKINELQNIKLDYNVKIVCISDTHNLTDNLILPEGDILLHAGDFTKLGKKSEVQHFINFMKKLKFKYKVIIAGNHDICFDNNKFKLKAKKLSELDVAKEDLFTPEEAKQMLSDFIYLENSGVEILGIRIFGSPIADSQRSDGAFIIKCSNEIRKTLWQMVPDGIDILLTHGPPYGINDLSKKNINGGCKYLLHEVINRIKPKYHVYGHIHEANGKIECDNITFINCAICCRGAAINKYYIINMKAKNIEQIEPIFFDCLK